MPFNNTIFFKYYENIFFNGRCSEFFYFILLNGFCDEQTKRKS